MFSNIEDYNQRYTVTYKQQQYTDIDDEDLLDFEIKEEEIEEYTNTIAEIYPKREITKEEINEDSYVFNLTEKEKLTLATLVKLEAGDQSWECQCAVASVVLNRYKQQYNGAKTIDAVIYAKGQFSPARRIKRNRPTQIQIDVVEYICKNGVTIPENVIFFHYKRYGRWGKPWKQIGTEYFSYA